MKKYYNIETLLYNKPWCITPATHRSLVKQFEAHIKGGPMEDIMPDMEDEEDDEPVMPPGYGMVCIDGIIGKHLGLMEKMCGGQDVDDTTEELMALANDTNIKNIVMYINSPGGTITGVPELAKLVSDINATKPVIVFSDGMIASAAYWIASQASAIYTTETAEVGSVGVYQYLMDNSKYYEKEGLKPDPIVHGKYKLMGADYKPLTDEERAMLQEDVDTIYNMFVSDIEAKRPIDKKCLEGQVYMGVKAVENNFTDGIVTNITDIFSI